MLFEWQLFAVGIYSWEGVRVKTLLALGQKTLGTKVLQRFGKNLKNFGDW